MSLAGREGAGAGLRYMVYGWRWLTRNPGDDLGGYRRGAWWRSRHDLAGLKGAFEVCKREVCVKLVVMLLRSMVVLCYRAFCVADTWRRQRKDLGQVQPFCNGDRVVVMPNGK